jgi:hypothetical protein
MLPTIRRPWWNTRSFSGGVTAFAWNPADADVTANFANSNRDFTGTTAASQLASARTTAGKTSGKWYCEITLIAPGSVNPFAEVGICNASFPVTTQFLGAAASSGAYYYNGAVTQVSGMSDPNPVSSISSTNNDVVQIAADFSAGSAWFGLNNTWQAGGNPGTGANPWLTWTPGGAWFFAASNFNSAPVNLRLAATGAFAPPSGFTLINA